MARITGETPLERIKERFVAANPGSWVDEDGNLIHHDQKSNTLHMVEIRTFDITEVARAERPRMVIADEADESIAARMLESANSATGRIIATGSPASVETDFPRIFATGGYTAPPPGGPGAFVPETLTPVSVRVEGIIPMSPATQAAIQRQVEILNRRGAVQA